MPELDGYDGGGEPELPYATVSGRIDDVQITKVTKPKTPRLNPYDVDSEFGPNDIQTEDTYVATTEEQSIIQLVNQRFEDSATVRREQEPGWYEALAFRQREQWSIFSPTQSKLVTLRNPDEPERVYATHDKLESKRRKVVARGLSSKTTITVKPLTNLDSDVLCAREASSGLEDLDVTYLREIQDFEMIDKASVYPHALKIWHDELMVVPYPIFDDIGEIKKVVDARLGGIKEQICSAFELYYDPKADNLHDGAWLIHAKLTPLWEIQQMFPELGKFVMSEAEGTGPSGYSDSTVTGITGQQAKTATQSGAKMAVLKEMWEKPGDEFPMGRLIYVAGNVLLYAGEWPGKGFLKDFPFALLEWQQGMGTPYGQGCTVGSLQAQRTRNIAISKMIEHLGNGDGKIIAQRGAEIDPKAYKSNRPNEIIYYTPSMLDGGQAPQQIPTPPIDPTIMLVIQLCDADMDDDMSVSPISQGDAPGGVTAASAFQLLLEQDSSDAVLFTKNIKKYNLQRARVEVALMQAYYDLPRLRAVNRQSVADTALLASKFKAKQQEAMAKALEQAGATAEEIPELMAEVSKSEPPPIEAANTQAIAFKNLSKGRITIEVTTSTNRSPAAKVALIMDLVKSGAFLPANLEATIQWLYLMELEDTDTLTTNLIAALERMQKREEDIAAKSDPLAAKMEAESAMAELKIKGEEVLIEAKTNAEIALTTAKSEADTKSKMMLAEQKHQFDMELETLKGQVQIEVKTETAEPGEESIVDNEEAIIASELAALKPQPVVPAPTLSEGIPSEPIPAQTDMPVEDPTMPSDVPLPVDAGDSTSGGLPEALPEPLEG